MHCEPPPWPERVSQTDPFSGSADKEYKSAIPFDGAFESVESLRASLRCEYNLAYNTHPDELYIVIQIRTRERGRNQLLNGGIKNAGFQQQYERKEGDSQNFSASTNFQTWN